MSGNEIKTIAFYLPQFHEIPENNEAYGKGFTEWFNTKKAKPLFEGHYQPRIPYNNNYYCLLDQDVMKNQAKLAQKYGVYGFCYYHYWFANGKKLLEKPIEKMLEDSSIDIPFCLCWANENWSKRWDGGNNEVIVKQDYGDVKDLNNHIDYLCDFFRDERYIRIDNKPLLLIYKPEIIPNLKYVLKHIRERIIENGFDGVVLVCQHPTFYMDRVNLSLFDYYIQFQPQFLLEDEKSFVKKCIRTILIYTHLEIILNFARTIINKRKRGGKTLTHRDYDLDWDKIINYPVRDDKLMAGAFVDWDNTARNKKGLVYEGSTPQKFEKYFGQLVRKVKKEYSTSFLFVNAWNEWAEGAYLEPDQKYGYQYLEALKHALQEN